MLMDWLKGADRAVKIAVVVVCGVLALGVLAAYVVLTISGSDTTEFRQWIITIANLVALPVAGVAAVASTAAAHHSRKAEEAGNGHLARRDSNIRALQAQNRALQERLNEQGPS